MDTTPLLDYLETRRRPIRDNALGEALHRALRTQAPGLDLELLADPRADVSHRGLVLANLLDGPGVEDGGTLRRTIIERLRAQPAEEALKVLETLRRDRRNGRRARSIGLEFLLGHERLTELAASHRKPLVRLFKHLLGERTWASLARALRTGRVNTPPAPRRPGILPPELIDRLLGRNRAEGPAEADSEAFLRRTVLRHARDPEAAREALRVLAGDAFEPADPALARRLSARKDLDRGKGLPRDLLFGLRGTFHPQVPASHVRFLSAADAPATEDRDGPLTALFKQALGEGAEPPGAGPVSERVAAASAGLPAIDVTMAIVLDLSGSSASSGERAHHPSALGLALAAILRDRVREVRLHQVGGDRPLDASGFARPAGETDLASAVLEAARGTPEAILVVTDGYENARPGDTAVVVEGLRRLGLEVPVLQVVPLFASGESLARRRLGEAIPVLPLEHERDAGELLARVILVHAPKTLHDDEFILLRQALFRK